MLIAVGLTIEIPFAIRIPRFWILFFAKILSVLVGEIIRGSLALYSISILPAANPFLKPAITHPGDTGPTTHADLTSRPFPGGSFDAVLAYHSIYHVDLDDLYQLLSGFKIIKLRQLRISRKEETVGIISCLRHGDREGI